MPLESKG